MNNFRGRGKSHQTNVLSRVCGTMLCQKMQRISFLILEAYTEPAPRNATTCTTEAELVFGFDVVGIIRVHLDYIPTDRGW